MEINSLNPTAEAPYLIAGPCSAESEQQVWATAVALKDLGVHAYRAGLWKPRTMPGYFEGVGVKGLPWMSRVQKELDLPVMTEVANARHVEQCLKYGFDTLWIGARTTTNPFSVQEIADSLQGVDITVYIKNPINPDLKLWLGGIERVFRAGVARIGAIHRGFSAFRQGNYRNSPIWQIPLELKQEMPDLTVLTDNSHICGRRDTLFTVAQTAMDLRFDGLMTEVHPDPSSALSDAQQQLTPADYGKLIERLVLRRNKIDSHTLEVLELWRQKIDALDSELIELVAQRMDHVEDIAKIKKEKFIPIFQPERWEEVLRNALELSRQQGLGETFVHRLFHAIHQESIHHQDKIMN